MIMEHFSISIFGRKHVCRLAYSINNLKNWKLRRFQRLLPFGTKTLCHATEVLQRTGWFFWTTVPVSRCFYSTPQLREPVMYYFDTTVFVDTRLWKTKHPRKHFQNFRQSCVLLTDWIEIHQSPQIRMLCGQSDFGNQKSEIGTISESILDFSL